MNTTFETLNGKQYVPMMSSISGYLAWPNSALQGTTLANVWQYGGNFTKIIGKHTIKVGADIETNYFHSPIGYNTESFSPAQTAGLGAQPGHWWRCMGFVSAGGTVRRLAAECQ